MTRRVAIAYVFASCIFYGQEVGPPLQFKAASVKLSEPSRIEPGKHWGCSGGPGTDSPTQIRCEHVFMRSLLMLAFDLLPYEYKSDSAPRNFSAPMATGGYTISAEVPRGATD